MRGEVGKNFEDSGVWLRVDEMMSVYSASLSQLSNLDPMLGKKTLSSPSTTNPTGPRFSLVRDASK